MYVYRRRAHINQLLQLPELWAAMWQTISSRRATDHPFFDSYDKYWKKLRSLVPKPQSHKTCNVLSEGNWKDQAHHQSPSHLQQLQLYLEKYLRKHTAPTLYKKAKGPSYGGPLSMTWEKISAKISANILNLILWAEHTSMGREKLFQAIKHAGICHQLISCVIPVVLEKPKPY